MSTRTVVHFCVAGLFALAVLYIMGKWNTPAWQENPMYPLISIITLAVVGGIFFVTVVLPRLGDAVGTVMYSSGEEVKQDDTMKAVAKLAAGDYEGAIAEFKKVVTEKPDDAHAISEISKIYAEKLHQPDSAIVFLQGHLEAKEWSEDNAAFLMFRMIDIYMQNHSWDHAKDLLEQVAGNFPGTRHSANARHKINELEQLQFKELQAQRARQSAQDEA
jgi:tetratricopeptide (TPR) repeat protein